MLCGFALKLWVNGNIFHLIVSFSFFLIVIILVYSTNAFLCVNKAASCPEFLFSRGRKREFIKLVSIPSPIPPTLIFKITVESLYQRLPQPARFHNSPCGEQAFLGENEASLLLFCLTTVILSFREPEATLWLSSLEGFYACAQGLHQQKLI